MQSKFLFEKLEDKKSLLLSIKQQIAFVLSEYRLVLLNETNNEKLYKIIENILLKEEPRIQIAQVEKLEDLSIKIQFILNNNLYEECV